MLNTSTSQTREVWKQSPEASGLEVSIRQKVHLWDLYDLRGIFFADLCWTQKIVTQVFFFYRRWSLFSSIEGCGNTLTLFAFAKSICNKYESRILFVKLYRWDLNDAHVDISHSIGWIQQCTLVLLHMSNTWPFYFSYVYVPRNFYFHHPFHLYFSQNIAEEGNHF